jgi:hypothetical protein
MQIHAVVGLDTYLGALLSGKVSGDLRKGPCITYSLRHRAVEAEANLKVALHVNRRVHNRAVQNGKAQFERRRKRSRNPLLFHFRSVRRICGIPLTPLSSTLNPKSGRVNQ